MLLLALYFLILTLANSFSHAQEQFQLLWYWILTLVIGFGLQAGLYSYIRQEIRQRKIKAAASKELAASAGISTGSMIACCTHHLVDVLPILGFSALFLFLAEYQVFFILLGILSNIVGSIFMLEIIKKHSLFREGGIFGQISRFNLKALKSWAIVGSALMLLIAFLLIRNSQPEVLAETTTAFLPPKTSSQGGLSVEVLPVEFSFNKPLQFEISLNTHQGDLDFDLAKKAFLVDDQGNSYLPLEWQGGRGGHHLSGILVFPAIGKSVKIMKLVMSNLYGVRERIFEWDLE